MESFVVRAFLRACAKYCNIPKPRPNALPDLLRAEVVPFLVVCFLSKGQYGE